MDCSIRNSMSVGNKNVVSGLLARMNNYRLTVVSFVALFLVSSIHFAQTTPFDVGIKVGQKIPSFRLQDQKGIAQEFASLKGSKGVVLLFFRSADW
jgi:hypothetical protein